jgi:hypothetical protein
MERIPRGPIVFADIYAEYPFDEIVFGCEPPLIIEKKCIEDASCDSIRPWEFTPNTDVKAQQNGECYVTSKKPSPDEIKRRAPKKPVPPEIKATFSYQERRRKNNELARRNRLLFKNPRQSRIAQEYMIKQLNSINLKLREEREALKSQLNSLLAQLE